MCIRDSIKTHPYIICLLPGNQLPFQHSSLIADFQSPGLIRKTDQPLNVPGRCFKKSRRTPAFCLRPTACKTTWKADGSLSAAVEGFAAETIIRFGRILTTIEAWSRRSLTSKEEEVQDEDPIGQLDSPVVIRVTANQQGAGGNVLAGLLGLAVRIIAIRGSLSIVILSIAADLDQAGIVAGAVRVFTINLAIEVVIPVVVADLRHHTTRFINPCYLLFPQRVIVETNIVDFPPPMMAGIRTEDSADRRRVHIHGAAGIGKISRVGYTVDIEHNLAVVVDPGDVMPGVVEYHGC